MGGFYPAPIKGRRAKVISDALKQSELHPDVPQGDIQALLWAIVRGADLETMPAPVQQTAVKILPKETLSPLKGATSAKAVENRLLSILNRRLEKNPQVQEGQSEAKQIDREYGISETVQAAKSANGAPILAAPDPVLRGTWAQMPGGFYVRYLPEATLKTRVQVMVPGEAVSQANPKTPLSFDPTQYLAVFAGSPAQRLGVSLRAAK